MPIMPEFVQFKVHGFYYVVVWLKKNSFIEITCNFFRSGNKNCRPSHSSKVIALWWLAPSPHNMMVPGTVPGWGLSMWSLHVLRLYVSSMHVGLSNDLKKFGPALSLCWSCRVEQEEVRK